MIRGKEVVAIIPVRQGSKGIPGKNLRKLGNWSLLERSIKQAQATKYIDRTYVSTDSEEMQEVARRHGAALKTLRPAELATDTAPTMSVLLHALDAQGEKDVYVLLLQATTPLRNLADFGALFAAYEGGKGDSIVSLVKHDAPHPDKIQVIKDGHVGSYLNKESMVARQLLPEVFALNGAFYLAHDSQLRTRRSFFSPTTMPYVMPRERSLNLDGPWDMVLLETLVAKKLVEFEDY